MTPTTVPLDDLLTGIRRTRDSLPAAMQRDGEAIYRRLLPRHQDAWDELGISVVWLTAELRRIRDRTLSAVRTVA